MNRRAEAKALRESGMTYPEICDRMGVSLSTARYLVYSGIADARRGAHWADELSTQTRNTLLRAGYTSRSQVKEAAATFRAGSPAGLGRKGVNEVLDWVGLPPFYGHKSPRGTAATNACIKHLEGLGFTVSPPPEGEQ